MQRLRKNDQRGDTIIEVLIALSILAFALTTSYTIMNKSLIAARNSQEHSEALEYMSSQVELVRASSGNPLLFTKPVHPPFCMLENQIKPAGDPACNVGEDGLYTVRNEVEMVNVHGEDQPVFTFSIDWDGPGSTGRQKETVSYKIYESSL